MTDDKPSKTGRKREQQALQRLGERLIDLDPKLVAELPLGERLADAIAAARRMTSREARRRQRQYIGKLMRGVDTAPVEALFDRLGSEDRQQKRSFAEAERWRDRIVREGGAAIDAFAAETGRKQPDIAALHEELRAATGDRQEKGLKKRLFRAIHGALVAPSADG